MRLTNTGNLTLTTSAGSGTVWTSLNDGVNSGLDADLFQGKSLAAVQNYNNLSNLPALTDAAYTTVASIRAGVPIGNYLPLLGGILTGRAWANGNISIANGAPAVSWQNTGTGLSVTTYFDASSVLTTALTDNVGGWQNGKYMQFSLGDGRLMTSTYGWLDERFAYRAVAPGQGAQNAFYTGGGGGNVPNVSGLELFDIGNGKHCIRSFLNNCTNCLTTNCNCGSNCGAGNGSEGSGTNSDGGGSY
jgi:hypothetical protein